MSYTAINYANNPNAPLGQWVGIDHGVAYSGPTTTDPKADEPLRPGEKKPENHEYGECVTYVKAVTPALLNRSSSSWRRGRKVSPIFHPPGHLSRPPIVAPDALPHGAWLMPKPITVMPHLRRTDDTQQVHSLLHNGKDRIRRHHPLSIPG
ncbi:MAG: hypothetical protein ABR905_15690 [Terracidiphilus sp.]|jgi:hypothetical protein